MKIILQREGIKRNSADLIDTALLLCNNVASAKVFISTDPYDGTSHLRPNVKLFTINEAKIKITRVIFCGFVTSVNVFAEKAKFTGKTSCFLNFSK